jgi:capsular polysaccharide export protein
MERGHSRDWNFIRQVCALNDVKDRVHVLDGGSLSLLTRHSAGMITINSTSGLSAIHHGVPLAVMGQAIYRHPELAFCVKRGRDLDRFWSEGFVAAPEVRERYLSWMQHECLVGGDFYAKEGIEAAITSLRIKLESALALRNANKVVAGSFGAAKDG